ncbi:MAG: ribonuclease III domain-containing protein [Verrucomicrobiales bacterium]
MKKANKKPDPKRREQELAWVGDTILDLYARTWILENNGTVCGEMLRSMTSNQFLACFGNPTSVEARIGKLYREEGMDAAFAWIEAELMPLFEKQRKNRH